MARKAPDQIIKEIMNSTSRDVIKSTHQIAKEIKSHPETVKKYALLIKEIQESERILYFENEKQQVLLKREKIKGEGK